MTLIPFSLLPFGSFFFFIRLAASLAIYLSWRHDKEALPAAFALARLAADKLPIQIGVNRKNHVQQIVTHDPAERYELRAGMLVAVVEQQAVSADAVAAPFFDKRVNSLGLLRCDFDHIEPPPIRSSN